MNELKYPFDSDFILKRRKSIRKSLYFMCEGKPLITKRIAILGGSTTHDIKEILELFLLDSGIRPKFYESEYDQYFQEVMFDNP